MLIKLHYTDLNKFHNELEIIIDTVSSAEYLVDFDNLVIYISEDEFHAQSLEDDITVNKNDGSAIFVEYP